MNVVKLTLSNSQAVRNLFALSLMCYQVATESQFVTVAKTTVDDFVKRSKDFRGDPELRAEVLAIPSVHIFNAWINLCLQLLRALLLRHRAEQLGLAQSPPVAGDSAAEEDEEVLRVTSSCCTQDVHNASRRLTRRGLYSQAVTQRFETLGKRAVLMQHVARVCSLSARWHEHNACATQQRTPGAYAEAVLVNARESIG